MSETTDNITWIKSEFLLKSDWLSHDGRFRILRREDHYYDLWDTTAEGARTCNKSRLSLTKCKELAEEIVAGEREDAEVLTEIQDKEDNSLPDPTECPKCKESVEEGVTLCDWCQTREERAKPLIEIDYMPGDFLPPGPENVLKEEFKPQGVEKFHWEGPPIPMRSAESRTKPPKKLRGGTNSNEIDLPEPEEAPSVLKPPKSREDVQTALNLLLVEKGTNFPNWSDFREILSQNNIDPNDVKQGMLAEAEQWARDHAEEEARKRKPPRMVPLEHLKPGTTFTVPGMDFSVGVLLSVNPSAAKVRITEGSKDREMDWSSGTLVHVEGKVELEKTPPKEYDEEAPSPGDVSPTKTQSEEVMQVRLDEARSLLVSLGFKATAVGKMSAEKVAGKLNSIDKFLDKAEEVEGDDLKLLKAITEEIKEGREIEVVEEGTEEQTDAQEETVEQPKKRGRKPKEKAVEETKIDERYLINGVEPRFYEAEKPKLVPLTEKIAREFKGMTKFPRDREMQKARLEYLRDAVRSKEFRGAEWVSAKCEENGETYRINGKHTSHVVCEFYDNKQEIDGAFVLIREFVCPTMADAAALFSTFDAKQSVRTKQDALRAFASAMEETSELPDWLITLLSAGLSFSKWEGRGYRSKSVDEQAEVMLGNPDFASWLKKMLEDRKATKFLARAPVIGAMAKTFSKDATAASEFWEAVRDECDDPKDAPRRRLTSWLLKHKLGGRSDGEGASEREFYTVCLKAWNAWRTDKKTNLTFDKEKDKETLAVV